jgi:hypothetical protein
VRALIVLLAACNGTTGTISVSLVTAPGSAVLDGATSLKVVVTNPHDVQTVERTSMGFDLSIDLPADGTAGTLIIDALDTSGSVIATGSSPPFPLGAIDAHVAIYMAPPLSIGGAPVTLSPARTKMSAGPLSYGAIFVGGIDAGNAVLDAVAIYNAYDHSLIAGLALPMARSSMALGEGASGIEYLFAGDDAQGQPASNLWRYDTKAAPSGSYLDYGEKAGFARTAASALAIGNDRFLITGTPAAVLDGLAGTVTARTDIAGLPPAGATVTGAVVFAGAPGVIAYVGDSFDTLDASDLTGASAVALPDGRVLVACGGHGPLAVTPGVGTASAGAIGASLGTCALAATDRYVVATDGTTVEVYAAADLSPVATLALAAPRTDVRAVALPNGQVLFAGGTETLELFTPDPIE